MPRQQRRRGRRRNPIDSLIQIAPTWGVQVRLDSINARKIRAEAKAYREACGRGKSNAAIVNEILRGVFYVPQDKQKEITIFNRKPA